MYEWPEETQATQPKKTLAAGYPDKGKVNSHSALGPVIFRDRGKVAEFAEFFFFFFFNVSRTCLLALFCPFCCPHTALVVLCLSYCPFTC